MKRFHTAGLLTFLASVGNLILPESVFVTGVAKADEPVGLRNTWTGTIDYFATGAPLAVDNGGIVGNVDTSNQPATVTVTTDDLPADVLLAQAYLYWAGTMVQPGAECAEIGDNEVTFTAPGQSPVSILADVSYCSEAGASSYDVQLHRADVTHNIGSIVGDYTVEDFTGKWTDDATDNASFSVLLIYQSPTNPYREVSLLDGLETFNNSSRTISHSTIAIPQPPAGNLTYYVLDGDVGGSAGEGVEVGSTNAIPIVLTDSVNPSDNPMNHTINTTPVVATDTYGVDLDEFPIDSGLASGDVDIEVLFSSGADKWWLGYFVLGIDAKGPPPPYIKIGEVSAPPDPSDCTGSDPDQYARMVVDVENDLLYICTKSGWLGK